MQLRLEPVTQENRLAVLSLRAGTGQEGFVETVSACLDLSLIHILIRAVEQRHLAPGRQRLHGTPKIIVRQLLAGWLFKAVHVYSLGIHAAHHLSLIHISSQRSPPPAPSPAAH